MAIEREYVLREGARCLGRTLYTLLSQVGVYYIDHALEQGKSRPRELCVYPVIFSLISCSLFKMITLRHHLRIVMHCHISLFEMFLVRVKS